MVFVTYQASEEHGHKKHKGGEGFQSRLPRDLDSLGTSAGPPNGGPRAGFTGGPSQHAECG